MHTWSEKVLLGAISACCVCDTWCLRSVKYLEFHALLWGGRVARLKGSGNVWTFKIPEFFLFFYHLLGKVPFPTVWELCLIINTCALIRCSKKKETSNVSAGNETLFLLSWTRLSSCDLAVLEVSSKPDSFHFALSRLGSVTSRVLGLKEMPLSFKLFNRFLCGQKNPECPLEACRTQDVFVSVKGALTVTQAWRLSADNWQQLVTN